MIICILIAAQAAIDVYFIWYCKNHWPANGYVRLPKHYQTGALKREADKAAAQAVDPTRTPSRVRKARIKR